MSYFTCGLFVAALVSNRKLVKEHLGKIQREQALRKEAEDQLRLLVASSPAAILTLNEHGTVLAANKAAASLFAIPDEPIDARPWHSEIPARPLRCLAP